MFKGQKFDPDYEQIQYELYIVFTYYCCFGDRENYTLLKIQNFRRMLSDAEIIKNDEENSLFDLIYSQSKKKGGIDFKFFIDQLPNIIKSADCEGSFKENVKKIIYNNFHILYEYLMENTQFGEDVQFINRSSFSEPIFLVLRTVASPLNKIYEYYFDIENKKVKENEELFKNLTQFTKQFELTPQLLTKTHSYLIFTFILNERSESAYFQWFHSTKTNNKFTFFHFVKYLVIVSQIANKKIFGLQVSDIRKISNLLERMQISKGFTSFCKKVKVNQHLIPTEQTLKKYEHNISLQSPTKGAIKAKGKNISKNKKDYEELGDKPLERILVRNYTQLKNKFIELCAYGETLVTSKLTHRKALSLLKELPLSQNELQVVISSVSTGSLDFDQFLQLLQKISSSKNIQLSEIVKLLLSLQLKEEEIHRTVPPFAEFRYNICEAMLNSVQPFLMKLFDLGAQPDKIHNQLSFLSLDEYLKIMYDFQITPHLVTKEGVIASFQKSLTKGYDFMTFSEFRQSFLVLLAYGQVKPEYYERQLQMDELLIIILETMNSSRGVNKMERRTDSKYPKEDYLAKFRSTFKESYPVSRRKPQKHQALRQLLR